MGISLDGFEELSDTLVSLGLVGKSEGKKALKEGAKIVLEKQKIDAPHDSGGSIISDGVCGAEFLDTTQVKVFKDGNQKIGIGITSENWEQTKGLWYQNFGYDNYGLNFSGMRIEKSNNVGWITKSLESCSNEAGDKIISVVDSEINKYL